MAISVETSAAGGAIVRRTADFHPTVWGDFFITRVFNTQETVNGWKQEIQELKEEARVMLTTRTEQLSEKLNLIEVVERLGIGYHFEPEIEEQLQLIYNGGDVNETADLSTVALQFRLLRQHGYNVTSDVFNNFKNEEGTFKKELGNDVRGMLSMYEAGYLRKHGETVLDEAIEFTTAHLTNLIGTDCMGERVTRALKGPLWKRVEKHEQLFFISSYEREEGHNQMLLELAKLSWNVLQDLYQQELRDITKWWIELDFAKKLSFARDRLVEVYFWAVGTMWEPKFSLSRYLLTKTTVLISITDDMYDVHGTNDELEFEQERGHVASAVECYMKQYNASQKQAVDALSQFIQHDWRDINEECLKTPDFVSREVVSMFLGLARVVEVIYKEFDGYTVSNTDTRDMMTALLVTPIVV
ncbi:(-)-germacrene D synthase [Linum perenne]